MLDQGYRIGDSAFYIQGDNRILTGAPACTGTPSNVSYTQQHSTYFSVGVLTHENAATTKNRVVEFIDRTLSSLV